MTNDRPPIHVNRPPRDQPSVGTKVRIAQQSSVANRDKPITLEPAPWEKEEING